MSRLSSCRPSLVAKMIGYATPDTKDDDSSLYSTALEDENSCTYSLEDDTMIAESATAMAARYVTSISKLWHPFVLVMRDY